MSQSYLGPNYLEILEKRLTVTEEKDETIIEKVPPTFSRILVVAQVNEGMLKEDIIDFHEKFNESHNDLDGPSITGFLLPQDGCMLHLIESTLAVSEKYLECLENSSASKAQDAVRFTKVKILHMAEDCPKQLFSKWYSFDDLAGMPEQAVDLGSNLVEAVDHTLQKLFEAAEVLVKIPETQLHKRHLHLVPSEGRIKAFIESDGFLGLRDYNEIYQNPIDIDLESELVWPLQPLVDYL